MKRLIMFDVALFCIALSIAAGLVQAVPSRSQQSSTNTPPLAFEVASIKQHVMRSGAMVFRLNGSGSTSPSLRATGNRFEEKIATLSDLIVDAYDVKDYQISGLPSWAMPGAALYDVIAESPGETTPTSGQLRQMLQTLLSERFHLKLRRETQALPVYELVIDKKGLKMKSVEADAQPSTIAKSADKTNASPVPKAVFSDNPTRTAEVKPRRGEIGGLVALISLFLDRPLIDKTGLTGTYEYVFDTQDFRDQLRQAKPAPSIFAAVQQQLGLKLESAKSSTEILIVDHAERPTED
jgi:uncharacterized protein (TIGR03435 family)